LFLALVRRDILSHYKQTFFGVSWALIKPFSTMVIFSLVFNRIGGIESQDGTPYPVFLYAGLLLWQYFSGALGKASVSLVSNSAFITKVYFPRLLIPLSVSISELLDFMVSFLLLVVIMFYYGFWLHLLNLIVFVVLVFCTVLLATGLGCFFAAVNVKYRDVNYALPFLIQTMMFVTPVVYPLKALDNYKFIKALMVWLNPMSGIITNARLTLLENGPIEWGLFGISFLMSVIIFLAGTQYFRNVEFYFADIV
jgi:lipopolysaccharide transport system permease protein